MAQPTTRGRRPATAYRADPPTPARAVTGSRSTDPGSVRCRRSTSASVHDRTLHLRLDEGSRGTTVDEDRRPDQETVTLPVGAPAAQAASNSSTGGTASTTGPLLATEDAEGFRARWTDIQTGFVDAPRRAVEQPTP
jgi:hypothetical protein